MWGNPFASIVWWVALTGRMINLNNATPFPEKNKSKPYAGVKLFIFPHASCTNILNKNNDYLFHEYIRFPDFHIRMTMVYFIVWLLFQFAYLISLAKCPSQRLALKHWRNIWGCSWSKYKVVVFQTHNFLATFQDFGDVTKTHKQVEIKYNAQLHSRLRKKGGENSHLTNPYLLCSSCVVYRRACQTWRNWPFIFWGWP